MQEESDNERERESVALRHQTPSCAHAAIELYWGTNVTSKEQNSHCSNNNIHTALRFRTNSNTYRNSRYNPETRPAPTSTNREQLHCANTTTSSRNTTSHCKTMSQVHAMSDDQVSKFNYTHTCTPSRKPQPSNTKSRSPTSSRK